MAEIFLMEDSAPLRRIITEDLRSAGYNVTALEDGTASEDTAFLNRADLLITDVQMPNVDGIEVVNNVRASHPRLPIIVIAGNFARAKAKLDVENIISKPFYVSDLIRTIEDSLRRSISAVPFN